MEEVARHRRSGLILGKFLPPHAGHLGLIREALTRVGDLTILVCSLPHDPIPGALRCQWVEELVPEARVLHVTDENPSHPEDDPRFWDLWTATIRRVLPNQPDLVFAGEPYGEELARRLGARAVIVDRSMVPVSGTLIRERPLAHWEHIPEPVRPWFVRRIVLSGSESTGKTTLARELALAYKTVWVPEFGRVYLDAKPAPLDASDIEPIARGQLASEATAARQANRLLILDTDLASTEVYARHYYGTCPEWIREAGRARPADLYLLLDIDAPWVPDPQRDRPDDREHMQALFRQRLEASGRPIVMVRGSWDERRRTALSAIDDLLRKA